MLRSLLILASFVPTMAMADEFVSLPRTAKELHELKAGDRLSLPQSRLDRVKGFRPFFALSVEGQVAGVKNCLFLLHAGEPTLLNSKTFWTVERTVKVEESRFSSTYVVLRDHKGRLGRLKCSEFTDGDQVRATNVADLESHGSKFFLKDEIMLSTAVPKSPGVGRD